MTTFAPLSPAAACPLCGQANQCAIAEGQDASGCWCMTATIATSALSALAPASWGQRCICPGCARLPECPPPAGGNHADSAL